MRALFVDTGVWLALLDTADPLHPQARAALSEHRGLPFIATDLVLAETVTLVRRELGPERARAFGTEFLDGKIGTPVYPEERDWREGLALIGKFVEQRLSLTDAVSIAVIRRMDFERVASFDKHFRLLLPERMAGVVPG